MNSKPQSVAYTDAELRNLIEEFIIRQKSEFTLSKICSYILYWAVEDNKVNKQNALLESDEMQQSDQERVMKVLDAIIADGRIVSTREEAFLKL